MALVCSLCACATQTGETASSTKPASSAPAIQLVDVVEYAQKGEIYGCEFALGASPDEIKTAYQYNENPEELILESSEETDASQEQTEESEDADEHATLVQELSITEGIVNQGLDTVRMATGNAKFYYHAAYVEEEGIAFIAFFDDPFSYHVGLTTMDEIKRTVDAEPVEDEITDDALFFYFGQPENVTSVAYLLGNNRYRLTFYFENGYLAVTTICDTVNWYVFQ